MKVAGTPTLRPGRALISDGRNIKEQMKAPGRRVMLMSILQISFTSLIPPPRHPRLSITHTSSPPARLRQLTPTLLERRLLPNAPACLCTITLTDVHAAITHNWHINMQNLNGLTFFKANEQPLPSWEMDQN